MKKSEALRLINKVINEAIWEDENVDDSQTIERTINVASKVVGISSIITNSQSQEREPTTARRLCYKHLREIGWTYQKIADNFGMDHSTVMYHLNKIQSFEYIRDPKTIRLIKDFKALIY